MLGQLNSSHVDLLSETIVFVSEVRDELALLSDLSDLATKSMESMRAAQATIQMEVYIVFCFRVDFVKLYLRLIKRDSEVRLRLKSLLNPVLIRALHICHSLRLILCQGSLFIKCICLLVFRHFQKNSLCHVFVCFTRFCAIATKSLH